MQMFDIRGGTLKVNDDLYWDSEEEYEQSVTLLLQSPDKNPTIDLTKVNFLFSPFMGQLVRFCARAREMGKTPKVLIGPQLKELCASTGLLKELPFAVVAQNSV
ncbi:MAG: hypothetical protein JW909_06890 [Planctomycetes bacterium]|nr:hypothetical protein [Planctomycetota bacterium]